MAHEFPDSVIAAAVQELFRTAKKEAAEGTTGHIVLQINRNQGKSINYTIGNTKTVKPQ